MAGSTIDDQIARLALVCGDLVRAYQFRDRNDICCHGVSVSQCYSLEALERNGPMTMGGLAEYLYLDTSTVTRIVDQLQTAGYVERATDDADRRIVRTRLTHSGRGLVERIRTELLEDYRAVLERLTPSARESVITAIEELLDAVQRRRATGTRAKGGRSA